MVSVVSLSWEDEKRLEEELYSEFVRLRVEENVPVVDVYNILGLSYNSAMAKRIRRRFKKEGVEVPYRVSKCHTDNDCMYIYETNYGFVISKTIKKINRYFGTYHDLELAKRVRDELIKCEWDKDCLDEIRERLGIKI